MTTKFQVGDKVKVLSSSSSYMHQIAYMIGKICEIKECCTDGTICVWDINKGSCWYFKPDELRLAQPLTKDQKKAEIARALEAERELTMKIANLSEQGIALKKLFDGDEEALGRHRSFVIQVLSILTDDDLQGVIK